MPGAPEAGPDLVGDQQGARTPREPAKLGRKCGGRHHAAAAAENGLDQHRADVARLKSGLDLRERRRRARAAARIRGERDVRVQLIGERLAPALAQAARCERAIAEPVVAALERDDARAFRWQASRS